MNTSSRHLVMRILSENRRTRGATLVILAVQTSQSFACAILCGAGHRQAFRPANPLSRCSVRVLQCVAHWLVDDDVAIANLDVIETVWVCTNPCLELDRRPLAAEV